MTRKAGVGRASASDGASWELNRTAPDALCYVEVRGLGANHSVCYGILGWEQRGRGGGRSHHSPQDLLPALALAPPCFGLQSLLFGPCLSSENKNTHPSQPPGTVVRLKTLWGA